MLVRGFVAALLIACGLAGGWFLHVYFGSHPPVERGVDRVPTATPAAPVAAGSETTSSREAAFDDIYHSATWGSNSEGAGHSGYGSKLNTTTVYRAFLQQFLKEQEIHSVVDAGCGDWEFSQAIDWTGIDYKGYDIVPKVVEHDIAKFAKPNIHFFNADIVEADLPPADLLISKHVLQHLPTADVQKFLTKQLRKYKYVLFTDGVMPKTLSADNTDIKPGEYRPLDLTLPPFKLPGVKALTYWDGVQMHQVLFISHPM